MFALSFCKPRHINRKHAGLWKRINRVSLPLSYFMGEIPEVRRDLKIMSKLTCECVKQIEKLEAAHNKHERSFRLKKKLKENRSNMETGSGDAYWDSVVKIVAEHYKNT